jgi:DNA-binding transcriptional LysR family regulator
MSVGTDPAAQGRRAALLDLPQVRTFVAIADQGSFFAAARRLDMSQPAVSQHVSKLEAAVGAQLLRRNRGECALTAEGERLLPFARALLAAEERCRAAVSGVGTLSIAASSNIGVYLLPRLLNLYGKHHSAPFDVSIGTNAEVYRRIENDEATIGLTEWWDDRDRLTALEWHKEPLVVIVHPEHRWAKKKHITAKELLDEPMIGGEPGTGTAAILREVFGASSKVLKTSMTLGSTEAVKQAVIENLGISIVMSTAVRSEVAAGRLCALTLAGKKLAKPLYAVCRRGLFEESAVGRFLAFITAEHARSDRRQ